MAATPGSSRWSLTNWTSGPVTLFQALGITKGTISYPRLQTMLTSPAAEAAAQAEAEAKAGTTAKAGAAVSQGVQEVPGASSGSGGQATGTGQAPGTTTAAGRGSGGTNTPASESMTSWIETLLTVLNAPRSQANIGSMTAWINHESPWNNKPPDGALYTNNPLNTKEPATGAVTLSNGIKKYVNAASGIAATAATIHQYPQILAALRSGRGLCGQNLGPSFARWSANGYTSVC